MNILQIYAHPAATSFTADIAQAFRNGCNERSRSTSSLNLYDGKAPTGFALREQILTADALSLVFPIWCEMPPAPVVQLIQSVLVAPLQLRIPVSVICLTGQAKGYDTTNLSAALKYVGLRPNFAILTGITKDLDAGLASQMLELATRMGRVLKNSL